MEETWQSWPLETRVPLRRVIHLMGRSLNTPVWTPPVGFPRRRQWQPTPVLLPGKSHGREPGRLQSMGSLRVGHDWVTSLSLFTFMHWRRKWQPTPVFLPGESQGWQSLVGCRAWWAAEPGGLPSMGSHRVGHDWSDLAAAAAAAVDFPGGSDGKASVYNVGDPGLIPELGRSPGVWNSPLQDYCLENPMDRGAW